MRKVTIPQAAALLADIGGTTARFALLVDGVVGPIEHARYGSRAFLDATHSRHCRGRVFRARALTNSTWIIDGAELG